MSGDAAANRRYRARHKERLREPERTRSRAYYLAHRAEILTRAAERYAANPEPRRERARREHAELREAMFAAYGYVCACCGEPRREFLVLDHIGGGGNRERASVGGKNTGVLRALKKAGWPQGRHRILCANCNQATALGQPCPHEVERLLYA